MYMSGWLYRLSIQTSSFLRPQGTTCSHSESACIQSSHRYALSSQLHHCCRHAANQPIIQPINQPTNHSCSHKELSCVRMLSHKISGRAGCASTYCSPDATQHTQLCSGTSCSFVLDGSKYASTIGFVLITAVISTFITLKSCEVNTMSCKTFWNVCTMLIKHLCWAALQKLTVATYNCSKVATYNCGATAIYGGMEQQQSKLLRYMLGPAALHRVLSPCHIHKFSCSLPQVTSLRSFWKECGMEVLPIAVLVFELTELRPLF